MFLLIINCIVIFKCFAVGYDDTIIYPNDDHDIKPHSNNFPHHHHHHPDQNYHHSVDFHRQHPDIPFPHESPEFHHHHHGFIHDPDFHGENKDDRFSVKTNLSLIPLDLIMKYNNFAEVNDVLLNLVDGNVQEKNEPILLEGRFGNERSAAVTPKAANCMPELQTVKIAPTDDPSVLYIPSCTRIERCGGCCSHTLLSCQPTAVETVSFQLVKTQFNGGSKLKYVGKEIVTVEKHTKCKCNCKVQAKNCNQFQEYRSNECSCSCTNRDEEKKCEKESATKLWNPEVCACQCRNISQCSTGYQFDTLRCKCAPITVRRRFAELNMKEQIKHKPDPLPVVPLHEVQNLKN